MGIKKKAVTLKDIARETGYSVNTVSRVLRDKPEIADSTRQTILEVAETMGHVRNMLASSLRSGVTHTIAVILGDVANPHFAIMMSEIEHYARLKGYATFLLNTDEDEQLELAAIQAALRQSVDGIILCPAQKTPRNILYMKEKGLPFVLIGRRFAEIPTNYVVCDDELGGYLATKCLLDSGHREVLLLNGLGHISSAAERRAGYLRAHAKAGLAPRRELMVEIPVTASGCAKAIDRLMQKRVSFSAIFAFSDMFAWKSWACLKRHGLRVPEDVSIIGFDYIHSRLELPFQLTSISSQKRRMSTTAVDVLLAAIQEDWGKAERQPAQQVVIHTALSEGQTVRNHA